MADTPGDGEWVTLISEEGHSFIFPAKAAYGSEFIKSTLTSGFEEGTTKTVNLPEIRADVVETAAEYLMYKDTYADVKPGTPVPDFKERVKPEIALELLMASDFLEC